MQCCLKVVVLCLAVAVVFKTNLVSGFESLNEIIFSNSGNDIVRGCAIETNWSPASYKPYVTAYVQITREDHCMLGCLMRKNNMIVNGKLRKDELIKALQAEYRKKNPTKMPMVKYVIDKCALRVKQVPDECTLASVLTLCAMDEISTIGH